MQQYQNVIQDKFGNVIVGASVAVYVYGTTTPATIYSGNGSGVLPSNMVTTNSLGEFAFYAANGRYSLSVSATNFVAENFSDFILFDPVDSGGIVASAISFTPFGTISAINVQSAIQEVVTDLSASSGSSTVGFIQSGASATAKTVQTVLRRTLNVDDFGAVGDGTTDDGPAFSAAYVAANAIAIAGGTYSVVELRLTPGKNYRIKTSIIVQSWVRLVGQGATLTGGITGYDRITNSIPTIPSDSDVAGQTAGACFIDNTASYLYTVDGLEFQDLHLSNFRFGMVSKCLAWNFPIFKHVFWENCNVGFFAYQGAHNPQFIGSGCGGGGAGTTFIGGATCYSTNHPYKNTDNFFTDGLMYDYEDGRIRDGATPNPWFDSWFQQSIFRGSTGSYPVGKSNYTYPLNSFAAATTPSGRNIWVPQRNGRATYATAVRGSSAYGGSYGAVCIANPTNSKIANITGENMFGYNLSLTLVAALSAGATSATLIYTWPGASGSYSIQFSDATTKTATFTNGSASISWTGGLASGVTTSIYLSYGAQSMIYVPLLGDVSNLECTFDNIDSTQVTGTALYCVEAKTATSPTVVPYGNFTAFRISGGISGLENFDQYPMSPTVQRVANDVGVVPYDPIFINSNNTPISANNVVWYRVERGSSVNTATYHCNSAAGNIVIGIYRSSITATTASTTNSKAASVGVGTKIYGKAFSVTLGYNTVSLGTTVVIRPGDWICVGFDNASAQIFGIGRDIAGLFGGTTSALFNGRIGYATVAGTYTAGTDPLPASPTLTNAVPTSAGGNTGLPFINLF